MCIGSHKTKHIVGSSKTSKTVKKTKLFWIGSNLKFEPVLDLDWFELQVRTKFWYFPETRF